VEKIMVIFKMLGIKIRSALRRFIGNYCIQKYNTCDVCFVWREHGELLRWESLGAAGITHKDQDPEVFIRKLIGQNVLQLCGVPKDDESIPLICLVAFPSVIAAIGLKKFIKLLKMWPGQSVVNTAKGEHTVVKYKLFGIGKHK
jgi:hypothetical protein